jgi:hypothetical protein
MPGRNEDDPWAFAIATKQTAGRMPGGLLMATSTATAEATLPFYGL